MTSGIVVTPAGLRPGTKSEPRHELKPALALGGRKQARQRFSNPIALACDPILDLSLRRAWVFADVVDDSLLEVGLGNQLSVDRPKLKRLLIEEK
jgi:hypothetical protein